MSQINDRLRSVEGMFFAFWCPGCKELHYISSTRGWTFDGNFDAPTITPSLLVTSGHYMAAHVPGYPCWCTYNAEHPDNPASFTCGRCHSFIRGGNIEFLTDSTHDLAGQTVPIPPLPSFHRDDA